MASADRLIEVFNEAKAKPAGAERESFLEEACRDEPALKEQVLCLLQAHEGAGDFLKHTLFAPPVSPLREKPGDRIGRYKLLEQIGEGGCGVVYMAEQEEPVRRRVALKVIKLGMDTKQVIARFEAERQALALMDHPNIAKVLDAGATDTGQPYFVMELVRGIRITDYCDQNHLPTKERLELFIQVCQAIQHAHQKGIIHRDIKPSNILVTVTEPGAPGCPKVIDFGIAKATTDQRLTDKTVFTAFEQFIGTPAYVSPEQAMMTSLDIDTRTDVYALGVLLYELLTGNTPFDAKELMAAGLDAMRRTILEQEPARPSTRLSSMLEADLTTMAKHRHCEPAKLGPLLRGDLDWIVMKALEKDRARRYESASGLATDIQRHLSNEPVVACPPSSLYRFRKLIRRNKLVFAASGVVIAALVLGVVVSTWQAIRATRAEREQSHLREAAQQAQRIEAQQRRDAEIARANEARQRRLASEQELLARRRFYAAQMNLAMQAWDAGQLARTLQLLETQRSNFGQRDLRSFEWFHLWGLCNARLRATLRGDGGAVNSVMFSPDGKTLAASDCNGTIRLWDVPAARETKTFKHPSPVPVYAAAFTPNGETLASGSWDSFIRLWDVSSGQLRATLSGHPGWVRSLAISPDGKTLASGGDQVLKLWDLATGIEQTNLLTGELPVLWIAYSSNGTTLATCTGWGGSDGDGISLWDLTHSPPQLKTKIPGGRTLAMSPDGKMLATAQWDKIELWDTDPVRRRATLSGHSPSVSALAFLPDSQTLASCAQDRTIRLWQLSGNEADRAASQIVGAHFDTAACLAVSRDGTTLASGATDGTVKVWEIADSQERTEARVALAFKCGTNSEMVSGLWSVLPSSVTDTVVLVTGNGTEIRDITSGEKRALLRAATGHGALSSDGRLLATSTADGTVKLWEIATGHVLGSIQAPRFSGYFPAISFSPDGRILATGSRADTSVKLWDATAGLKPIRAIDIVNGASTVAFSPDGKRLAVAIRFQALLLIDLSTGRLERNIKLGSGAVDTHATVFSPDGNWVATGGEGGTVQLWDVQTGRMHAVLKGHTTAVYAIAFSPDGGTVATGGADQTVRLWDALTGQERVTLKRHQHEVSTLAFTPDGNTLLTGDPSGTVWRLRGIHTAQADEGPVLMNETGQTATDYNHVAWRLATDPDSRTRDGQQAVDLAEKAVAATNRKNPVILDTLAAAYAEARQFTNAVAVQQEAIFLLQNEQQKKDYAFRLKLYESNLPYRDHGRLAERASFTEPDAAGPDFAVQGEYVGNGCAAQVIALGDGKFHMVGWAPGLPGTGPAIEKQMQGDARREGDKVVFDGNGWKGVIERGTLTGTNGEGKTYVLQKTERTSPTVGAKPPPDAVVLFDGTSADAWDGGKMDARKLLYCGTKSKGSFSDCALHIEFRTPFMPTARGQARGNSGVYLQDRYECQVLDSFGLNGENFETGGIYGMSKPTVNMCLPPLSWQTYDIEFEAAKFGADGKKKKNARMSVKLNGVLVQDHMEVPHTTILAGRGEGPEPGPIQLQTNGAPVLYRNIWVVEK